MTLLRGHSKAAQPASENPLQEATWLYSYADLMTQLLLFAILMLTVLGLSRPIPKPETPDPDPLALKAAELERRLLKGDLSQVVAVDRAADRLVIRMTSVLFDRGKHGLKPNAKKVLDNVVGFLQEVPNRIRVEGHTDDIPISTAAFPSNWELSTARAISVVHYLQSHGIGKARLSVAGYGEYHAMVPNRDDEHRALNRRVEIVVMGE